jgi:hypothetical protein
MSPRLFCCNQEVVLDPELLYSETEVFAMCLKLRQQAGSPNFDAEVRFEACPSVPVPFACLLLTCNLISNLHNDSHFHKKKN